MDGNIEKAIASAREISTSRAINFRGQETRLQNQLDAASRLTRITRGKAIKSEMEKFERGRRTAEARAFALETITDLEFVGENEWFVKANYDGAELGIHRSSVGGRITWAVVIDGKPVADESQARAAINIYSSAVGEIKDELRVIEIHEEIRARREEMGGGSSRPTQESGPANRVNPKDHLGYFKLLGIDLDAMQGLSEDEVTARVKAMYRASSRFSHPDTQHSDDATRMRKLNEAEQVLSDPKKRKDYMERKGDFDPRSSR